MLSLNDRNEFANGLVFSADRTWLTGDEFLSLAVAAEIAKESFGPEMEKGLRSFHLISVPDPLLGGWPVQHSNVLSVAPGEIWLTKMTDETSPKFVVIYRTDAFEGESPSGPLYEVFPVSLQHQFAGPFDLKVERDESPLGVGFMVEAYFPMTALASSLDGCVGKLTDGQFADVRLLLLASFGLLRGEENRAARDYARAVPHGRPYVKRDDIRLRFRDYEREQFARLFWEAEEAIALMGSGEEEELEEETGE